MAPDFDNDPPDLGDGDHDDVPHHDDDGDDGNNLGDDSIVEYLR